MSTGTTAPRGQPKIREFMASISQSVEAIKLRLVGDSALGSVGLVQDVEELKANQKKTAEVLSDVANALSALETHRSEQLKINAQHADVAEHVKAVRMYFRTACIILPIMGGVIGWLLKNADLLKRLAG